MLNIYLPQTKTDLTERIQCRPKKSKRNSFTLRILEKNHRFKKLTQTHNTM